MTDPKDIGRRIEQRRKELNLTLKDVADKACVSLSTISRYERGEFDRIKLPVVMAIANALGVSHDYIVCKTDNPFPDLGDMVDIGVSPSDIRIDGTHKRGKVAVSPSSRLQPANSIRIAGRDGSFVERRLTDEQLALFQSMLDQMKPIDDENI